RGGGNACGFHDDRPAHGQWSPTPACAAGRCARRRGGGLFFNRLERVTVLAIEHRPAGGGELFAQRVGGGEVFGLLRGPAFFGERGDIGGDVRFRGDGFSEVEAEGEEHAVERGDADVARALVDEGEQRAERAGGVKIVVERGEHGRERVFGAEERELRAEGTEVFQRALGGVERIEGEVERLAWMAGEERIAERGGAVALGLEVVERVEVAERLAHLFAVNEEVLAVIPVTGKLRAVAALALGDLVFVV